MGKRRRKKQPKVVVIGGGTGLSVMLRGLKKYPVDLSAIVTVADDGGSSGKIRQELDIPPPGDVRNVLVALSDVEQLLEELMQHRFKGEGDLAGHPLGNLMLAAMTEITGDFFHAVREMSRVLNVQGKVLPAANQPIVLHAEYTDGTAEIGESQVTETGKGKRIKGVYLEPQNVETLPETIAELQSADLIVIGPGSLYTSVLPDLLVPQIGEEVKRAKAKKVFVCNVMTQAGETDNYTASDHVQALYDHLGEPFLDSIIVSDGALSSEILQKYAEECSQPVHYDNEELVELGLEVIHDKILTHEAGVFRHDTGKLAEILCGMIGVTLE